jgi:L-ascorbate 6-phosphate lactonase
MNYDITWIGQGGFIFKFGDRTLCIDPYLSDSVKGLDGFARVMPIPVAPQNLSADIILCTHDHPDHLDDETIKYTDYQAMMYAGPVSCRQHFIKLGIPEDRLILLNRGDLIQLGDAQIYGVYAAHTPDSIGIIVKYAGITVYLVGDSRYVPKLVEAEQYDPDILLCCINGKLGNMNCEEAALLASRLAVKVACPCHYGMFIENTEDPLNFKKALSGSGIRYFKFEFNLAFPVHSIMNFGIF